MKKLLSLLLALVATTCLWAHDFAVNGIFYNYLEGNNVEVTYEGSYSSNSNEYSDAVTIPETVTYNGNTYSVTSIGDYAFYDCSSLTSLTIPNSVTSIGNEAFHYCSSLTSVTIPNSVTSIGEAAFSNCYFLTSINIPSSVTNIGRLAFVSCSSIVSITISNMVTKIDDYVFAGCSSLASISIPNSVTSIGNSAFSSCISLTSITIPNSVTSIGNDAFYECYFTKDHFINNSSLDAEANNYWGAKVVDLEIDGLLIRNDTVIDCRPYVTIAVIPNSVTSIGYGAFSYCSALTSISIPNSVTSIGSAAFSGCSSLTKTNYTGDIAGWCNIKFGSGSANPMCYSHNFYINDQEIKDLVIPNTVNTIRNYAFYGCSALTSITIPNSVMSIGDEAFRKCQSLTSITIPNSVTSIGYGVFAYCSGLTSITCEATAPPTLGSDIFYQVSKSIPVYVPCGCVSAYKAAKYWNDFTNIQEPLTDFAIAVNVNNSTMGTAKVDKNTSCGNQISATANYGYHFVQWSDGVTDNPRTLILTQDTVLTAEFALTTAGQCGDNLYWIYDEGDQSVSITGSGGMYDYTSETQPWLLFKEQIIKVTTSNTATSIGPSAFEGCIRLGKVTLGSSIQNIAAKAFAGCTRLYDVYCYATYPPFADATSFANYNVYLYVPCENQRDYTLDMVWGNFKFIECIESEDVTTDGVVITPTTNDVTIIWPTEGNADTYTIVIKKGNEVFCTLTFNADGQLLNIAFAPGRNGNHPVQYAEQAGNGYRFTVTGLEEGTHYAYNIDVRDAANKTIKSYTGEFTTESLTAVENTHSPSPITNFQKIIRNGQLLILRDGVEYTIMGQEL